MRRLGSKALNYKACRALGKLDARRHRTASRLVRFALAIRWRAAEHVRCPSRNLRMGRRLIIVCCFGPIAIGIIALAGYVLGNASVASLGVGKPVSVVTALTLIALGAGLLAQRSSNPASALMHSRRCGSRKTAAASMCGYSSRRLWTITAMWSGHPRAHAI